MPSERTPRRGADTGGKHALSNLEQDLRARHERRPPRLADYHGTKQNQFTRRTNYESDLRHWRKYLDNGRGQSQEERDRGELGAFHEWIRGARAAAAQVQSIAKYQAAARRKRVSLTNGGLFCDSSPAMQPMNSITLAPLELRATVNRAESGTGYASFIIRGEPVSEDWRQFWIKNGRKDPYCRISLWFNSPAEITPGRCLGGYGGELWPSAWPKYFSWPSESQRSINNVGHIYLTQAGADLLLSALHSEGL